MKNRSKIKNQKSKLTNANFDFEILNFTFEKGSPRSLSEEDFAVEAGFTLLELLIVVGIIGVLLAVSSTAYTLAQRKSRDTRRITDMKAIQAAFEQYAGDNKGVYPNATSDVSASYLPIGIPVDPKTKVAYTTISFDGTGPMNYEYCACALLESASGGNSSTSHCNFSADGSYYCVRDLQ